MVGFSVEVSVSEKGFVKESRGYLKDSNIELEELLAWTKSQLILISDQVLSEEQLKGFDKHPIMLVDGSTTKKITEVSPLGKVEFISRQNISDILLAAYNDILELSKVKTGRYKSSHYVFLNGIQEATDLPSLEAWLKTNPEIKDNDIVRIVNIQPYARRLELLGVTSERQQSRKEDKGRRRGVKTGILVRKPNGAYQLALRRIKNKFRGNISVSFKFIPGAQLGISAYFKKGRSGKNSAGRTYLYPSLIFVINQEGIF